MSRAEGTKPLYIICKYAGKETENIFSLPPPHASTLGKLCIFTRMVIEGIKNARQSVYGQLL